MIRLVVIFVTLCFQSFSHAALATETQSAERIGVGDRSIKTYRHTPCDFWRFDSNVTGNICTYLDRRIEVADANDLVSLLRDMIQKIEDLERRVKELEGRE